jgi:glutamate-1-semialdehyde 2,1-aminomutase
MAAGLAMLNAVSKPDFYTKLSAATETLINGLKDISETRKIPMAFSQVGSMFGVFFSPEQQVNYFEQVVKCDIERFKLFYHGMLNEGIYLAPSAFEAGFVSSAHGPEEIQKTIDAADRVLSKLS